MVVTSPGLQPIDRVLDGLRGVKSYRRGYIACCPAHGDRNPSLMVWEDEIDGHVGIKCFAGCTRKAVVEAIGLTESDLYINGKEKSKIVRQGITTLDLAVDKLIHPHLFDKLGITDKHGYNGCEAVYIPYYTTDGKPYARYRIRTALTAKEGSFWSRGDEPLIPYGLDHLEEARNLGYIVIVEGESDCWTLWLHKLPALGIPGTQHYNKIKLDYLTGIERVYIIQEPDAAGHKFIDDLIGHLHKIGYKGKIYAIDLSEFEGAKDPNDLHKRNVKGFKATFQIARGRARLLSPTGTRPVTYRLRDLQQERLPATKWAVPDILPEGLTLLVGKPKLGKSFLILALLIAIAFGGAALGNIPVEQGEVLYISLEDNKKRLQKRANTFLGNKFASKDFHYATSWPRLDEGGLEALEEWISEHPRARIISIDTWARFKPRSKGRQKLHYDEDYDALAPLQELASKYSVSIVVVDHMRKMESEDPLDMVAGTTGKTGAVDGFLLLFRKRGETDARLFVTGKDIEEEGELVLSFSQECASWTIKGPADEIATTAARQAILDILKSHPQGLGVKEIANKLEKNVNTTRNLLVSLRNENKVLLRNNLYTLVAHSKSSKDSKPSNSSNKDEKSKEGYYPATSDYYSEPSSIVTSIQDVEGNEGDGHYGYYSRDNNAENEREIIRI